MAKRCPPWGSETYFQKDCHTHWLTTLRWLTLQGVSVNTAEQPRHWWKHWWKYWAVVLKSAFVTFRGDWSGRTWLTAGSSLGCCVSGLSALLSIWRHRTFLRTFLRVFLVVRAPLATGRAWAWTEVELGAKPAFSPGELGGLVYINRPLRVLASSFIKLST